MTTPNLDLAELASNSLQPSVPVNSFLQAVDALLFLAVEDNDLTAPPTTVIGDVGKCWIIAASATGAWAGKDGQVALCTAADTWRYFVPREGWRARVKDEDVNFEFNGSSWAVPAGSSQGRHAVWIAAGAMTPSATGGCAALATIASAANQPDIQSLDFDPTTQEYTQFGFRMPKSWDEGTITFAPVWSHGTALTNFGVVWDLQAVGVSNDDPIAVAFGTAQLSTDTGGTTNDVYIGPESAAITISGTPQPEDMVFFRLSRVTGNGSDNLAVDARLHGITVYMTTNADTDA